MKRQDWDERLGGRISEGGELVEVQQKVPAKSEAKEPTERTERRSRMTTWHSAVVAASLASTSRRCLVCERDLSRDPMTGAALELGRRKFCGQKCGSEHRPCVPKTSSVLI